jgi:iron complex outermembrane receptor protein
VSLFSFSCTFPLTVVAQSTFYPLEEVVVTAGFREQSLMTSPGSITVIDESVMKNRAAQHLESVLHISPNINYSGGTSRARFVQIRGVGDLEQFVDPKHFPAVGILIDDINFGGAVNAGMLFDIGQVEISRGPQGTQFGTSALAGIVNIRSNRPTDSFEGYAEVGLGDYGSWNTGGVISGPISNSASARVSVHQNKGDGYMNNVHLGRSDTNGYDETAIRATIEVTPNDSSNLEMTAFYFDGDNGYDAFSLENSRKTLSDKPGKDTQDTLALAVRGSWQLSESTTLESTATWLNSDLEYGFDEDWTYVGICDGTLCDPVNDFYSNTDNYLRDRSEISFDSRLLGNFSLGFLGNTQYVLGIYAQRRKENLHRQSYGDFFSFYDAERSAIYGQADSALTERLGITAGMRYENFNDSYNDTATFKSSSDDGLWTEDLTLTYLMGENSLLYATISSGAKAGGVNTEASAKFTSMQTVFQEFVKPRLAFESETLINREIGLKGLYLNDQLTLRTAVFYMSRNNAQLESWMHDSVGYLWIGFLDNVDGTNWGAEVEVAYKLSDRVQLIGSFGLLETEIDQITTYDLDTYDFIVRKNIDQTKSPQWQYYIGINAALTESLNMRIDLEGRDASRFGYYHEQKLKGYDLLNASLSYQVGSTELLLWGRNLVNNDYAVHGFYFGNDPRKGWKNETYYQYGEPRVIGFTVRHSF